MNKYYGTFIIEHQINRNNFVLNQPGSMKKIRVHCDQLKPSHPLPEFVRDFTDSYRNAANDPERERPKLRYQFYREAAV